jgi:hypothetical protein
MPPFRRSWFRWLTSISDVAGLEHSPKVVDAGTPVVVAVRLIGTGCVRPIDDGEGGTGEVGTIEIGVGEVDAGEVRIREVCLAQIDTRQICTY